MVDPDSSDGAAAPRSYSAFPMFLKTVQGNAMKSLFEVLKEIVHEVTLKFGPEGVSLSQVDGSKCALAQLRLNADAFEEYHCPSELYAGVYTAVLFKVLRGTGSSETITMYTSAGCDDQLTVEVQDSGRSAVTKTVIQLVEVFTQRVSVPQQTYDYVATLPSLLFQRLCRDAAGIGQLLTVAAEGRTLELSCNGLHVRQHTVLSESLNGLNVVRAAEGAEGTEPSEGAPPVRIQNDYKLKFLTTVCKASGLCNTIELQLKQNFPILLKYNAASLGELTFMLSPSLEEAM